MSVLDKLLILKEKTILITGEKMKLNVAYEAKRLVKTVSKWDKTQLAVIAYLRLTDTATGEYQLPARYAKKDCPKALSDEDISSINGMISSGTHVFYIVKHGVLAGSPDVDLVATSDTTSLDEKFKVYEGLYT